MIEKNNNKLYGSVIFILVAASFVFCWKSVIPQYQENEKKTAQLEQDIKTAKIRLESLKTTKADIDKMGDTVDKMLVAVPGDNDSPNLITELEAIATKNKTYIPSIQISDSATSASGTTTVATTTSSNNQVAISFTVDGTFEDLSTFITDLENDVRFMNVSTLTLSNSSTETDNKINMAIQITAFKRAKADSAVTASSGTELWNATKNSQ